MSNLCGPDADNQLWMFPFNQFPQRVGSFVSNQPKLGTDYNLFPFNQFPQRVGRRCSPSTPSTRQSFMMVMTWFPFNQFPQRVGRMLVSSTHILKIKFPFNQFPQRVGSQEEYDNTSFRFWAVFPFNQFPQRVGRLMSIILDVQPRVSIQLVSPTSGENCCNAFCKCVILFPFNQFPQRVGRVLQGTKGLATLYPKKFPFNQFPQRVGRLFDCFLPTICFTCFHSISFPNEWGDPPHDTHSNDQGRTQGSVSIQLVSPTSGERTR